MARLTIAALCLSLLGVGCTATGPMGLTYNAFTKATGKNYKDDRVSHTEEAVITTNGQLLVHVVGEVPVSTGVGHYVIAIPLADVVSNSSEAAEGRNVLFPRKAIITATKETRLSEAHGGHVVPVVERYVIAGDLPTLHPIQGAHDTLYPPQGWAHPELVFIYVSDQPLAGDKKYVIFQLQRWESPPAYALWVFMPFFVVMDVVALPFTIW